MGQTCLARLPCLDPDPVPAARAAVLAALPQPVTVAGLAAALGTTRSTLHRALRRHGTTPSALIRQVRLGRALDRLDQGASVAEAGRAAGYADASVFSRAFRQRYGLAPSQWARAGGSSQSGAVLRHGAKHEPGPKP